MKKFIVFTAVFLSILALLTVAVGGEKEEVESNVIGISKIVSHPALDAAEQGIQDELADLGYDFEYDLQNANGEVSTAASIANKFKSENVRIAVGIATPTAQALANALNDINVVYTLVTDPVDAGLVDSYERGGANITGVSDMTPVKDQIEFLNRIKKLDSLGHVYSSGEANAVRLAEMAREACREMGIEFIEATVTNSAEVKQATQTIIGRVDGIYVSTDNTVVSALSALTEVAMENRVPVMSADPSSAEKFDVLAAWGFDYYKMGRVTGRMIADIIEGAKPEDIPTKFMTDPSDIDLLINLDVAEKLGLTFPRDYIDSASKIVENGKLRSK
jgi:putative ABC transport system substrate-binding protein